MSAFKIPDLVFGGDKPQLERAFELFDKQEVDWDLSGEAPEEPDYYEITIKNSVSVTGQGTFFGKASRTLTFEPSEESGWWIERTDQKDELPISVSVRNVWTTDRNIVLRSGSQHNYLRMVEHIVALRLGLCVDNLIVKTDSGDPPLFDRGSLDLVEAIEGAGCKQTNRPVSYVTVREPVALLGNKNSFLIVLPCTESKPVLSIDCAIDFPNAIGKQRLKVNLNKRWFKYGSEARTNTTKAMMLYCYTIGKIFADIRHLGYTEKNILIAGKKSYVNEPMLFHNGKSLEAIWHRTMMDLLAALALIEQGRICGKVISYRAGHSLDVSLCKLLCKQKLLVPFVWRK
jgi:UDP-3-O-acyl-N-acetylglucosamine deacetylase